ncbi:MAG TPA: S1/P1 nuclease [Eudoraea sp.]|nr:S1/P1 nuclease [Eudoraea sp.]
MKKLIFLALFSSQLIFGNPPIWSKTGHRVIGEVAQGHLSGKAKKAIKKLLDGQSLAAVSNFADEIKADSLYRKFSAWHYVNFPADEKYGESALGPYGDIMIGIQKCMERVKDKNQTRPDRIFYLKMLIHLIGDLHQPMHIGRLEDKGGNDIKIEWFNRESNLHKLWDADMINDYGMSYTELAAKLPRITRQQIKAVQKGTIYDWVEESQEVANRVYNSVEMGEKLYYRYSYTWWDTVEDQLQKGGLRLAKVLNELF